MLCQSRVEETKQISSESTKQCVSGAIFASLAFKLKKVGS